MARYEQTYNVQPTYWTKTSMEETNNKLLIHKTITNYEETKHRPTEIELHALDEVQVIAKRSKHDPKVYLYQETQQTNFSNLDGTDRQLNEYNQTITTSRND